VVQAYPLKFHILSVEVEPGFGSKAGFADSDAVGHIVHHLLPGGEGSHGLVQIGVFQIPEHGRSHFDGLGAGSCVTRGYGNRSAFGFKRLSVGAGQNRLNGQLSGLARLVDYSGLNRYGSLARGDFRGGDKHPPLLKMQWVNGGQKYMTVDAASGVPTGGGLHRIVHPHGNHIGFGGPEGHFAGQFILKGAVSERPFPQMLSVDPDIAVGHNAFELDKDSLPGFRSGNDQVLAVPSDAGGHKTTS